MEQSVPPHGTNRKVPPPWVEGAASVGRRCRLRGSKMPPPWVEGAAFERRRYGLQGFWCALYIVFPGKKGRRGVVL